jgi:lipoprotein-anchoring transpeptidase ErfK/SrfK
MKRRIIILLAGVLLICILTSSLVISASETPTPTQTPTGLAVTGTLIPNTVIPTATPVIITPTITAIPTRVSSYTVQAGDTLTKIAEMFGISWGYLADQNHLKNPDLIYVDQVLTIPEWPPETSGREIYVVLSEQKVYAIENGETIKEFVVSTGTSRYPTVIGRFEIYVKYESAKMSGGSGADSYYLPNVPFIMYFYQGYGLHGTYWHNNFGAPMSHGCVNLRTEDAEWLFNWAGVGTPVIIID